MAPRKQTDWADHYSPKNQLVLEASGATQVAGYREWKDAGRQVRKGEHGIRLDAPVIVKDKETGEPRMVNVRTVVVFDVSQTDPIAYEEDDEGTTAPPTSTMLTTAERDQLAQQRAMDNYRAGMAR